MEPSRIRAISYLIAGVILIPWFLCWALSLQFISHKKLRQKLDDLFTGRTPLDDDDFYVQYFAEQGIPKEIPIRVRQIFSEMFDADFSRISNTDDFSEEMKFIWGFDSMIDAEIMIALEEEFGISIPDGEAEKMRSIQDLVAGIWKQKQKPNQSVHSIAGSARSE